MNTYHYTYQIGKTSEKTEAIEANSPEEAQAKSFALVHAKSKKLRQGIKKFQLNDPFQDGNEATKFKGGIILNDPMAKRYIPNSDVEVEHPSQQVFDLSKNHTNDICENDLAIPSSFVTIPSPYSSEEDEHTPFLYFLSYSTTEPCETGRVVVAIPFKLNSELKIELCERILADILECTPENVVLTNFVLLNEWKGE